VTVRHQLAPDRTLIVSRLGGLMVLGIRGPSDAPISGPLAIREADVAAFLAAVTQATGGELAADMERVREVLRAAPGVPGFKRLKREVAGMSMARRREAVEALRRAGEIVDRGDGRRPRLHLASSKAGNPPSYPPSSLGAGTGPSQEREASHDAGRTHAGGAADVASTGGTP
jgi:hypothetical protein